MYNFTCNFIKLKIILFVSPSLVSHIFSFSHIVIEILFNYITSFNNLIYNYFTIYY